MGNFFSDAVNEIVGGAADIVSGGADLVADFGRAITDEIQRFGRDINDEWNRFVGRLFDIPDVDDLLRQFDGVLLNYDGATSSIPVVYGLSRVGGVRAAPPIVTGASNEYVHLFIVHSEGEIGGYGAHYLDGVRITDPRFAGLYRLKTYTGAPGQTADADAIAEIPGWTANHKFEGLAYTYLRLKWDRDSFGRRVPDVTTDLVGRYLWDPRTSSTTTIGNPALVARDYLTNPIYGKGIPEARINDTAFGIAADYYDELITPYSGAPSTKPRAQVDGVLDTGRPILANLRQLSGEFGFEIIEPKTADGKWSILVNRDEASVYSFDRSNIFGRISVSESGRRDRYNRVTARFRDSALDWEASDTVFDSPVLRAEDNGRVLETNIPLQYTANWYQAQRIIEQAVKQSRNSIGCAFVTDLGVLAVTEGSVVDVTEADYGWDAKLFRIARMKLLNQAMVMVTLTEHESTVYDTTVPPEQAAPPDTNLPDPWTVRPPTGVTVGTGTIFSVLGGVVMVLTPISWTLPDDAFVVGYEIEWRLTGDPDFIPIATVDSGDLDSVNITLPADTDVDVRVIAVNSNSVRSVADTGSGHTAAPVLHGAPLSVSADVTAQSSQIRISWSAPDPGSLPVARFDVYRGDLSSTFETSTRVVSSTGLTALDDAPTGAWFYWVVAVNSAGVAGPESASAAVSTIQYDALLWSQDAKVYSDSPVSLNKFGAAVHMNISGKVCVIGEPGRSSNVGRAHIFDALGGMDLIATLAPSDVPAAGRFGSLVAAAPHARYVAVSAPTAFVVAGTSGKVYIFTGDQAGVWSEQAIISPPSISPDQYNGFGSGIDLDGRADRLIIGASSSTINGIGANAGEAAVYSRAGATWTVEQRLTPAAQSTGARYGSLVKISDDGLVAAVAHQGTGLSGGVGGVVIWTRSGTVWTEGPTLSFGSASDLVYDIDLSFDGQVLVVASSSAADEVRIYETDDNWLSHDHVSFDLDATAQACSVSGYGRVVFVQEATTLAAPGIMRFFSRDIGGTWRASRVANTLDGFKSGPAPGTAQFSRNGRVLVVGSQGDDDVATDAGAVYLFTAGGLSP